MVLKTSQLDAALQAGLHKGRVEEENHLLQPASYAPFDASQDSVVHIFQLSKVNLVWDLIISLTEAQVDDIHNHSRIQGCIQSIVECHFISLELFSLGETILAVSKHLLVFPMFQDIFQEVLFHDVTRHSAEAARLVVPKVQYFLLSSHWVLPLTAMTFQV